MTGEDPFARYAPEDRAAIAEVYTAVRDLCRKIGDLATVIELDRVLTLDDASEALGAIAAGAAHARQGAHHLQKLAAQLERILDISQRYE